LVTDLTRAVNNPDMFNLKQASDTYLGWSVHLIFDCLTSGCDGTTEHELEERAVLLHLSLSSWSNETMPCVDSWQGILCDEQCRVRSLWVVPFLRILCRIAANGVCILMSICLANSVSLDIHAFLVTWMEPWLLCLGPQRIFFC
jgi:hypothetical protein